jgi:tetratricopeptide (TPR) repeat protein
LAVVVIAGIAGLTGLYLRAEERREAAETAQRNAARAEEDSRQQAEVAEKKRQEADRVKHYLVVHFLNWAKPETARNRAITFEEVLDKAADRIGDEFKDQPALEAYLRHEFGDAYQSLGKFAAAETHLRRAVQMRRDLLGPNHADTLSSRRSLGSALLDQNKLSEAETVINSCLNDCLRELGPGDMTTVLARADAGRLAAVRGQGDKVAAITGQLADTKPFAQFPEVFAALKAVREVTDIYQQPGPAEEKWPKVEAALRPLHEQFVKSASLGPTSPITLNLTYNLGYALHMQGKLAEAEPFWRQCWEGRHHVLGPDHQDTSLTLSWLILCLLDQGKGAAAEKVLRPEYELRAKSAKADLAWAEFLALYGWALTLAENPSEAEPVLRECKEIRRKALDAENWLIANIDSLIGDCVRLRGQFAEAEPLLVDSYNALAKAKGVPRDRLRQAGERIVKLYEAWGKKDLAEKWRTPPKPPEK